MKELWIKWYDEWAMAMQTWIKHKCMKKSDDNYYSWIMASQGSFYKFFLHIWNFSLKKAYMKKVSSHFIEHIIIISLHFLLLHISLCYFPKLKWKKVKVLVAQSCLTLCNPTDCIPPGPLCPWNFPGNNTGVGSHSFQQKIFLTQGSN